MHGNKKCRPLTSVIYFSWGSRWFEGRGYRLTVEMIVLWSNTAQCSSQTAAVALDAVIRWLWNSVRFTGWTADNMKLLWDEFNSWEMISVLPVDIFLHLALLCSHTNTHSESDVESDERGRESEGERSHRMLADGLPVISSIMQRLLGLFITDTVYGFPWSLNSRCLGINFMLEVCQQLLWHCLRIFFFSCKTWPQQLLQGSQHPPKKEHILPSGLECSAPDVNVNPCLVWHFTWIKEITFFYEVVKPH